MAALTAVVDQELGRLPKVSAGQVGADSTFQTFFTECEKEAKSLGDSFISLDVCLLTFAKTVTLPAAVGKLIQKQFAYAKVREWVNQMAKGGGGEGPER